MMSKISDLPQDLLREGHCIEKAASGDSMLPSIPDSTVLRIEPLHRNKVGLGDVVYFLDDKGNTKIHRISCVLKRGKKTLIQTWGDNCDRPDAVIMGSQILGRVTAYREENQWYQIESPAIMYLKYFLKRYGWYYLKKISGKLLNGFSRSAL